MDLHDFNALLDEQGTTGTDGPVSEADIVAVEASFDARLPEVYRSYLRTVGGGRLGDLHLFSVPDGSATPVREGNYRMRLLREDVLGFAGNDEGDVYAFPVLDHACQDAVVFWDHEQNQLLPVARPGFLDFVAGMAFETPEPEEMTTDEASGEID